MTLVTEGYLSKGAAEQLAALQARRSGETAVGAVSYAEDKAAAGHGMGALVAQKVMAVELTAAQRQAEEEVEHDFTQGERSDFAAHALPFTE